MVPSIYPLETLHNSLSLRQVNDFLTGLCRSCCSRTHSGAPTGTSWKSQWPGICSASVTYCLGMEASPVPSAVPGWQAGLQPLAHLPRSSCSRRHGNLWCTSQRLPASDSQPPLPPPVPNSMGISAREKADQVVFSSLVAAAVALFDSLGSQAPGNTSFMQQQILSSSSLPLHPRSSDRPPWCE